MPGVSEEQVTRAREIDLLSYLRAYEPGELKPDGPGRYTTVTHGSLVISNGKWNWNAGGVAGVSALDYGSDNPGAKSQGIKQLMAGGGIVLIGLNLVPLLSGLFG